MKSPYLSLLPLKYNDEVSIKETLSKPFTLRIILQWDTPFLEKVSLFRIGTEVMRQFSLYVDQDNYEGTLFFKLQFDFQRDPLDLSFPLKLAAGNGGCDVVICYRLHRLELHIDGVLVYLVAIVCLKSDPFT